MGRLAGQLVVITGASRGIGAATALAASEQGGDVVLVSRDREAMESVATQIRARSRRAWVIPVDLRAEPDAIVAAKDVLRVGTPDVLLANAGLSIARGVLDCVERHDSYTRSMGVNFLGTVAFCGPLLEAMTKRGSGHLIGVTTATSRIPIPGWGSYAASKAAFDAWQRVARPELAEAGVFTTIAKPALVDTDMVRVRDGHPRPGTPPQRVAEDLVSCMIRPRAEVAPWWVRPAEVATAIAPHTVARLIWAATRRSRPGYPNSS